MTLILQDSLVQSVSNVLAADTTITGTTFATLLSTTVLTNGGNLFIDFSCCSSNTTGALQNRFRITIDGTTVVGMSVNMGDGGLGSTPGGAVSGSMIYKTSGLSAASHTVVAQWSVSGGTGRIRPVAAPADEYATLLVEEITV